jgi:8-hydroxy-5-deazaflavin:NADPH oxidoreductase
MKIGIIGTGALGGMLAKQLAAAGYKVKVTDTSHMSLLKEKAIKLGAEAATIQDVARDVDMVIISIPTKAIPDLPKSLWNELSKEAVVIDTTNYYPYRDGTMEELANGKLESVWVSEQLGRPVVKALNNLLSYTIEHCGLPKGKASRVAVAISGDDEKGKENVSKLINDIGFDTVDAGSLLESWRHQPGTPAYCTELNATELKLALMDADHFKGKAAYLRDLTNEKLMARKIAPSHQEMLSVIRSLFPENPLEASFVQS